MGLNDTHSKVYGDYKSNDGETDNYEPSYIVYNKKKSEDCDFKELYVFASKMCKKYLQNEVYIKPANKPPYYINGLGKKTSKSTTNAVKYNREKEEYFTTIKRSDTNKRFTSDISFENFKIQKYDYVERMKKTQGGEIILDS